MKTIQITMPEDLLQEIDQAIQKFHKTRSAFIRDALFAALRRLEIMQMEARFRAGYKKKPAVKNEYSEWEDEQVWGD